METGYYAYETASDGLCEYSTKRSAVRHAAEAANREGKAVTVYSQPARSSLSWGMTTSSEKRWASMTRYSPSAEMDSGISN